jgi:hypothetical protein
MCLLDPPKALPLRPLGASIGAFPEAPTCGFLSSADPRGRACRASHQASGPLYPGIGSSQEPPQRGKKTHGQPSPAGPRLTVPEPRRQLARYMPMRTRTRMKKLPCRTRQSKSAAHADISRPCRGLQRHPPPAHSRPRRRARPEVGPGGAVCPRLPLWCPGAHGGAGHRDAVAHRLPLWCPGAHKARGQDGGARAPPSVADGPAWAKALVAPQPPWPKEACGARAPWGWGLRHTGPLGDPVG